MRNDLAGALRKMEKGAEEGAFIAEFLFDPRLPVFQGHFPERPLLPGVLQIEMMRYAAERFLGCRCDISRVGATKFSGEIRPANTVTLEASVSGEPWELNVKGKLLVGPAVAATISLTLRQRNEAVPIEEKKNE